MSCDREVIEEGGMSDSASSLVWWHLGKQKTSHTESEYMSVGLQPEALEEEKRATESRRARHTPDRLSDCYAGSCASGVIPARLASDQV